MTMEWLAMLIPPFLQWLWQTTLIASLVICLILAAQKLLGQKLGPRWSHALWLVLLIRMVVPWAPQSRISLLNLLPSSVRQAQPPAVPALTEQDPGFHSVAVSDAGETAAPRDATASPSVQKAAPPKPQTLAQAEQSAGPPFLPLRRILPVLWFAGAAIIGAYLVASHIALWRIIKREGPLLSQSMLELFEECRAQMGVQTLVAVVPSGQVRSPALFGFVRPRLLLPRQMLDTASRDEMRYVFLHELAHLKRHDIYLAWVASLLQVLHWFNPLIWLAFHRMRIDREMACDALVLTYTGERESQEYGRAIVALLQRLAQSRPLPAMAGILENKAQLKRRMTMIAKFKSNSYRWSPLAVTLVVALGCASLPNARSGKAPQPPGVSMPNEQPTARAAGEGNVFVDPNSGIEFHKVTALSGPSDVIDALAGLEMSPNGKFLLSGVKVVPLDGGKPFDLVDTPKAKFGSWSPNGKWVAFVGAGAIWLLPVGPETSRPTGPAEKLLEEQPSWPVTWSPDSESITFLRGRNWSTGDLWTLSLKDKSLAKVTDRWLPWMEKQSPDGKHIAFTDYGAFWVKPAAGGEAKKIGESPTYLRERPMLWSADDAWVVFTGNPGNAGYGPTVLRFFRLADNHEVTVTLPMEMGGPIGVSPDQKKLFFYRDSHDPKAAVRVVSVSGGPTCDLGAQMSYLLYGSHYWSPDSRMVTAVGELQGNDWNLWGFRLSGGAPVPLRKDISVPGEIEQLQLSPDLRYLLVSVPSRSDDKHRDLWAAPVSWKEMRTTGPAKLVFKNWTEIPSGGAVTPGIWSPDGNRIAIMQRGTDQSDIWIASPEGGEPVQLTSGPGLKSWPAWSPDGKMIAFVASRSATDRVIQVVSASGGEARTVIAPSWPPRANARFGLFTWSPDGRALTVPGAGVISSVSIADGGSQPLVNLTEIGEDTARGLRWSPDGKTLAFRCEKPSVSSRLYLLHSQDGHVTRLLDERGESNFWSPDGKWISYGTETRVRTRPESVVWEMDMDEAVAKLNK
jgi:beta-lactamase regulating signal transducer with metallopeptidase domain/Tol biopolymer transport system component